MASATLSIPCPSRKASHEAYLLDVRTRNEPTEDAAPGIEDVRVFVSVEAGATLTGDPVAPMALPGGVFNDIAPGYAPLAFSNPTRVDADGDGAWTPPGLHR